MKSFSSLHYLALPSLAAILLAGGCAHQTPEASFDELARVSATQNEPVRSTACELEFIILGAGQDAGSPQIGNSGDPAWTDDRLRHSATAAALVDHRTAKRYLFEASPDLPEQLHRLDELAPSPTAAKAGTLGIDGMFLTHAHIGHYAGLMFLGREAAATRNVPVYAMPRMADYLSENGPWSQLVDLENIALMPLEANTAIALADDITVTPLIVPHRDEFSETVGFVVKTGSASLLFLPDIDSWAVWKAQSDIDIVDLAGSLDHAFIDASFFADGELKGRDMSAIPHPRVRETMALFDNAPDAVKATMHFIHYNHTNPIRDPASPQSIEVVARGFSVAREGDIFCLGSGG